mgnify:CR=1 FL=1
MRKNFYFLLFNTCSFLSDYEHGEKFYLSYNEAISNNNKKDGGSHMAREVQTMMLPQKGVLFLGGHQNMTKKLRQQFPKWTYVTDDQIRRCSSVNQTVVFYWTKHSSHKMMRYVYSKLPEDASIIYVTATNLSLLIEQMQHKHLTL